MYVAFLRGMNLGKRRIKNPELCACFEALGYREVSAFLASGNVLFDCDQGAAGLERAIEGGLEARLGYPVPTFVRSASEVATIAARDPFDAATRKRLGGKHQIAMLNAAPNAKARKAALALATPDDALASIGKELHWLPAGGTSDSELQIKELEKLLGGLTIRTQRTLERLADKLASG
ncbi:MAG: DUF1697 domain-containing protein [Myxococcales bacterium]|nr:DUF1697 domain-containing protein [Myxococcales bacterium]